MGENHRTKHGWLQIQAHGQMTNITFGVSSNQGTPSHYEFHYSVRVINVLDDARYSGLAPWQNGTRPFTHCRKSIDLESEKPEIGSDDDVCLFSENK